LAVLILEFGYPLLEGRELVLSLVAGVLRGYAIAMSTSFSLFLWCEV
jgi:hypothetical protein